MPGSRDAVKGKSAKKSIRPRRDFEALKQRRLRAAGMFRRGKSQVELAGSTEDHPVATSKWWTHGNYTTRRDANRARALHSGTSSGAKVDVTPWPVQAEQGAYPVSPMANSPMS